MSAKHAVEKDTKSLQLTEPSSSPGRMAISVAMFLIGRVASVSPLVTSARALVIARLVSGMGVGLASASAPQVGAPRKFTANDLVSSLGFRV